MILTSFWFYLELHNLVVGLLVLLIELLLIVSMPSFTGLGICLDYVWSMIQYHTPVFKSSSLSCYKITPTLINPWFFFFGAHDSHLCRHCVFCSLNCFPSFFHVRSFPGICLVNISIFILDKSFDQWLYLWYSHLRRGMNYNYLRLCIYRERFDKNQNSHSWCGFCG